MIGYNYSIHQQNEIEEVQKESLAFPILKNKQDIENSNNSTHENKNKSTSTDMSSQQVNSVNAYPPTSQKNNVNLS